MGCGSHRAGDGSYRLVDKIDRIPCKRACKICQSTVDPEGRLEPEGLRDQEIAEMHTRAAAWSLWRVA